MEIVDSRIRYVGGQGGFFGGIILARPRNKAAKMAAAFSLPQWTPS
jgi:hypothetical protein